MLCIYTVKANFFSREVMQRAGDVQSSLARELAEYEMQVEQDVLAPMTSLLEVLLYFITCAIISITYNLETVCHFPCLTCM